jgi:uncharacterized coiled-coil protein SlyX
MYCIAKLGLTSEVDPIPEIYNYNISVPLTIKGLSMRINNLIDKCKTFIQVVEKANADIEYLVLKTKNIGFKPDFFTGLLSLRLTLKDAIITNLKDRDEYIYNCALLCHKQISLLTAILKSMENKPEGFDKNDLKMINHLIESLSREQKDIYAIKKAMFHLENRLLNVQEVLYADQPHGEQPDGVVPNIGQSKILTQQGVTQPLTMASREAY